MPPENGLTNEQALNAVETQFPSALSDLVSAFQAVKEKGMFTKQPVLNAIEHSNIYLPSAQKQDDKLYKHQMLDTSYQFVPDVTDSDRYVSVPL